jgi:hypothetical protein
MGECRRHRHNRDLNRSELRLGLAAMRSRVY